jgi:Contractile injection system tube protein
MPSTTFPRSPKLNKGAIVSYDQNSQVPKVVLFQYNPDSLNRSLQAQTTGGEGDPAEVFRFKGAPIENINLEIELDATDKLENPNQNSDAVNMGIYPQLAALEIILYPNSKDVENNSKLASQGTIEIIGPEGPFALFIWGPKRVVPIRLSDFKVIEEAHDANLNPIRAKVSLGLRVLTYDDFPVDHRGYKLFLSHQKNKEKMAGKATINNEKPTGARIEF